MRQFFRLISSAITRDDLFLRALCLTAGIIVGGLGVLILIGRIPQWSSAEFSWYSLFLWLVGLLLSGWGGLLLSRCVVPAKSRIADWTAKCFPDPNWFQDTLIVLAVFAIPAILLTLALRLIGVKGQQPGFGQRPAKKKVKKSKRTT